MATRKENDFAISEEGKEKIADRLRVLIGKRSVRAAAQDWGLSFSTLNNYLTRGTEPSLNVVIKIANVERVSVEWIATGTEPEKRNDTPASASRRILMICWSEKRFFMGMSSCGL